MLSSECELSEHCALDVADAVLVYAFHRTLIAKLYFESPVWAPPRIRDNWSPSKVGTIGEMILSDGVFWDVEVHCVECDEIVGYRYVGQVPSPDERLGRLWADGTIEQRVISLQVSGEPIGYATLYRASLKNSYAWLAAAGVPRMRRTGAVLMGIAKFITLAFDEWPRWADWRATS